MTTAAAISVDEAIRLAVGLQQCRELGDAEKIYQQILQHRPDHPDALHFLGVLNHQRGNHVEAARLISNALERVPDYADAHLNLGNVYKAQDQIEAAEACYRRVLELRPDSAPAYNNLGSILNAKADFDDAEKAFLNAIALDSSFADAYYNLGNTYSRQGKIPKAVEYYSKAVLKGTRKAHSQRMLGTSLICLGRTKEAADVFRRWLENEPDNPEPKHLLAACSGTDVPPRAPDDFVRQIFDVFAADFEERLTGLDYRAPQLIEAALSAVAARRMGELHILDAGCGTGLCGPLLRPYARELDGVDLSGGMLRRAQMAACYDRLEQAELTAFIRSRKRVYDVVVSADTLCYFGKLNDVTHAVAASLRPGGHFLFTVEHARGNQAALPDGYRIGLMGRYAHSERYIRKIITEAGLVVASISHDTLRKEMGRPVAGLIVTASDPRTFDARKENSG